MAYVADVAARREQLKWSGDDGCGTFEYEIPIALLGRGILIGKTSGAYFAFSHAPLSVSLSLSSEDGYTARRILHRRRRRRSGRRRSCRHRASLSSPFTSRDGDANARKRVQTEARGKKRMGGGEGGLPAAAKNRPHGFFPQKEGEDCYRRLYDGRIEIARSST